MFPEIPVDLSSLTAEELQALLTECLAAAPAAREAATTPEQVAAFSAFATGVQNVRVAIAALETPAEPTPLSAEDQAALDAANAVFAEQTPPADPDPETPADPAPADPDPEALSAEGIAEIVNDAVAAAFAARVPALPRRSAVVASIGELAARVPAGQAPLPAPAPAPFTITAAADIPNVPMGAALSRRELAEAMVNRARQLGHGSGGPDDRVPVATFSIDRGPDRTISHEDTASANSRKVRDMIEERESIVAAGGLCAPVNPFYEQRVFSQAWRPVFGGAVPTMTVDRGGLRFNPPPGLADITSGVGTITAAADLAGGAGAAKACFTVTCAAIVENDVEADYVCVQFGNFGAMTFPENVEAWMELAAAAHARSAETNRLTDIKTGAPAVTAAGLVGAGREVLTRLEQQAQGINSAIRRPSDAPVEAILSQWVLGLIRADFTRSITDEVDLIGATDQEIGAWLAARHILVTLTPDAATGNSSQIIAAPATGVIKEYPSTVIAEMFIPGTYIGLDSGTLNLGLVRDSVLTMGSAVAPTTPGNQFRMFYEDFEALSVVGPAGSRAELTMSVCADGTYGAAKAVTCPIVT